MSKHSRSGRVGGETNLYPRRESKPDYPVCQSITCFTALSELPM